MQLCWIGCHAKMAGLGECTGVTGCRQAQGEPLTSAKALVLALDPTAYVKRLERSNDDVIVLADGTTHIGSGGDWTKALAHLTDKGWKLD